MVASPTYERLALVRSMPFAAGEVGVDPNDDKRIWFSDNSGGNTPILTGSAGSVASPQIASGYTDFRGGLGVGNRYDIGTPANPTQGVGLFTKLRAGREMLAQVGPAGQSSGSLQPNLYSNRVGFISAVGGASASVTATGLMAVVQGTATPRGVNRDNASANNVSKFTAMRRVGFVSGNTAGSVSGLRHNVNSFFTSSTSGLGGFFVVIRAGISQYASGNRVFFGLTGNSAVLAGGSDPSSYLNTFGLGADAADVNMQIMQNGASGTALKTNLGSGFPANTSLLDMYELTLFAAPGSMTVKWAVENLTRGGFPAVGTFALGSKAPLDNFEMAAQIHHATSTTTPVGIDFVSMYIETDN